MLKTIQSSFQEFEKAKIKFTQQLADFASKPQNIDQLHSLGALKQLRTLLLDPTESIKNSAALALGRIANHSEKIAQSVVEEDVLPQLISSLSKQNNFYKKAACFVIRSLAKHSNALSTVIVSCGALEHLAACVEEADGGVRQSAAWALAYIAKYNEDLAKQVAASGCIPGLVAALQDPNSDLKRIAAFALNQISKHSSYLAQQVVDADAIPNLTIQINHNDPQLKKQCCQTLGSLAKHTPEIAQAIVAADLFPKILYKLNDHDQGVRKAAATLIREIVKQGPEQSKAFSEAGGITSVIEFLNSNNESMRLPGIVVLGYVGAYAQKDAMQIIQSKGIKVIKQSLIQVPDDLIKGASAWALGQIGGHSKHHADALAEDDVLTHLLAVYIYQNSTEELKKKAKKALKNVISMCDQIKPLQALIEDSPEQIQVFLLKQIAKVVAKDKEAKKLFASEEGLRKVLKIKPEQDSKLEETIDELLALYSTDVIEHFKEKND